MRKFVEKLSAKAAYKNMVSSNAAENIERRRRREYHYSGDDHHHEKGNAFPPPGGDESLLQEDDLKRHAERSSAVWVVPGDTVRIGKRTIKGGFFYLGSDLLCPKEGLYADEPSLVDPELEYIRIKGKRNLCICCTENYQYGYRDLSPYGRASYLGWLAGGRDNPESCPGYAYIYFCGFERRLLVDDRMGTVSRAEFMSLVAELQRLETVYGDSLERMGASVTDLLSYVIMTNSHGDGEVADMRLVNANLHLPDVFRLPLALDCAKGKPVSPEVALAWVRDHPDYSPGTCATRCEEEFDDLFLVRYRKMYGEGLRIRSSGANLGISVSPVNDSLYGISSTFNVPDASVLKAPFRKLEKLAGMCAEDLSSFDSFVNDGGGTRTSAEAIFLLPDDLLASGSYAALNRIRDLVKNNVSGRAELVPVRSLLGYAAGSGPQKIGAKESLIISEIAQREGLVTAPDIRFHDAEPDIDGNLVLFPGGSEKEFVPSEAFEKMVTALRLGTMVLDGDENVKSPGADMLRREIDGNALLTETEKRSLYAYLLWRVQAPRTEAGLRNRIDRTLDAKEKTAVARLVIRTAVAAAALSPAAVRRIETVYKLLGLEKREVAADIHSRLSSERDFAGAGAESSGGLDSDLINAREKETREVRAVLEDVFEDADEPRDETDAARAATDAQFSGLDADHALLYRKLVAGETLSAEEFRRFCDELSLMPEGAVETINDWTFDRVGAPLVKSGSTVFVDAEVVEEIKNLEA